jgi:hypothetical protein
VTRFLLGQFVEFLQLTGLAPFAGFRADDFSFFEDPTWEKQAEVKGRLIALSEEVLEVFLTVTARNSARSTSASSGLPGPLMRKAIGAKLAST